MKLRLWHIAFFGIALAVFGLALAPATIFAPQRPGVFTYARLSGPIWSARAEEARLGAYDVGTLEWRLSPRMLLGGALVSDVTLRDGEIVGDVSITFGWRAVKRIQSSELVVRGVPLAQGAVIAGATTIRSLDIVFDKDRCHSATGELKSEVLEVSSAALGFRGPSLSGAALCGTEEAWLPLEGGSGAERFRSVISLRPNGDGRWQADVFTATMDANATLLAAGFKPVEGEPYLQLTRTFQWFPL